MTTEEYYQRNNVLQRENEMLEERIAAMKVISLKVYNIVTMCGSKRKDICPLCGVVKGHKLDCILQQWNFMITGKVS